MKIIYFVLGTFFLSCSAHAQLTVQQGAGLYLQHGADITLQGDMESDDNISGEGYVTMKGSALQNINMHGKHIGSIVIDNENNIELLSPMTLAEVLHLEKGILQCGSHTLSLGEHAVVDGGNDRSFIATTGSGEIRKSISGNLNRYLFPVGNNSGYAPLIITSMGNYHDAYVQISSRNKINPNKPIASEDYLDNFWSVNRKGINGTLQATAIYRSLKGEEQNLKGFYWNGITWSDRQSQIDTRNHTVTVSAPEGTGEIYAFRPVGLVNSGAGISVFPNPVRSIAKVQISSNSDMETDLQVYDLRGHIVITRKVVLRKGLNQFDLDVNGLAKGQYMIRSSSGNIKAVSLIKG